MEKTVKILKIILGSILFIFVASLCYQNMGSVPLYFLNYPPVSVSAFIVVLLPASLVFVICLFLFRFRSISMDKKMNLLERHVKLKESEIESLRNEVNRLREQKDISFEGGMFSVGNLMQERKYHTLTLVIVGSIAILLTLVVYLITQNVWIYIAVIIPLVIVFTTFLLYAGLRKRFLKLIANSEKKNDVIKKLDIVQVPVTILTASTLLILVYVATLIIMVININY